MGSADGARSGEDPRAALRAVGLRVTASRLAVMAALEAHPHAEVDELVRTVRSRVGSVSHQSVYNVLAALGDAGLVRRIEPAGSAARFETRVGDNHHHIVCRSCNATTDVDCAVGRRPCLTPSETKGYVLDEAEVTFWGLCPRCQTTRTRNKKEARDTERSAR